MTNNNINQNDLIKILGDDRISFKSRFNPNLSDELNREQQELDRKRLLAKKNKSKDVDSVITTDDINSEKVFDVSNTVLNYDLMSMDVLPACNNVNSDVLGSRVFCDLWSWESYWYSNSPKGKVMASAADYYHMAKRISAINFSNARGDMSLYHKYSSIMNQKKMDSLIKNLTNKSNRSISTSTVLIFGVPSETLMNTSIIHHRNSNKLSLVKESLVTVPYIDGYRGGFNLDTVLDSNINLEYMRKIFDTNDDKETLIQTITFMSGGYSRDSIRIDTASERIHYDGLQLAIFFNHNSSLNQFQIFLDRLENNGVSFGVKYK